MASRMYSPSDKLDDVIRAYELMSPAEVEFELAKMGIDPRPTIEAVTALVTRKIGSWKAGPPDGRGGRGRRY